MPSVERVFEPSHIRRGRLATSPTWYVVMDDGSRWRFARKKDATRFIEAGAVCPEHEGSGWVCRHCGGQRVRS